MSGSPNSMRRLRVAVHAAAFAVLLVASSTGAEARGQSTRQQLKPFCKIDYLRLCSGNADNRASVVSCFKKNIKQVSDRCRTAIANHTEYSPKKIERRRSR